MRNELLNKSEGDIVELDGTTYRILAIGINYRTQKPDAVLLKPVEMSGGGQSKDRPKPVTKIQGTQHRQKQEKQKPKITIRWPWKK